MKNDFKERIFELRKLGWSYSKIAKALGCAKSTVNYYMSNVSRTKRKTSSKQWKLKNIWIKKLCSAISQFKSRCPSTIVVTKCKDWNKKLRTAVSRFRNSLSLKPKKGYTYKDVIQHFGGTVVNCELTGQQIDLTKDDYCIDHIIPIARGGTNELDNLAFTIPEANAAKNSLTNEEFVELCKKVCEHFGYIVTKQ